MHHAFVAALVANAKREQQMRDTLEDLRLKLAAPGLSDADRARLSAKAEKIVQQLEQTM